MGGSNTYLQRVQRHFERSDETSTFRKSNEANEAPSEEPRPSHEAAPSNEAAPQEMSPAPVPEHQKRLYEPTVNESFRNQRSRVDKQETLSFLKKPTVYGPMKSETARSTPYDQVATEDMNMQIEVDVQKIDDLPPGWHLENGWLCLDNPEDEWVMEGNWLIRNHYIPRNEAYRPSDEECPIDLNYLASVKHIARHLQGPMEETQSKPPHRGGLLDGTNQVQD